MMATLPFNELMLIAMLDINYYNTAVENDQVNAVFNYCFYLWESLWRSFSVVSIPFSKKKMEKCINILTQRSSYYNIPIKNLYIPKHVSSDFNWYEGDGSKMHFD